MLITPARNEEAYIEKTIQAVIAQTILPRTCVIVSDGSTDRTDDIVKKYIPDHPWIDLLVRMPEHRDRNFAAKVMCFKAGYEKVKNTEYDIIGSLDADITFGPDYFEFLLRKLADIPELGVVGTPFVEGSTHYDYRFTNIGNVSGACQMFRRECFGDIGGYVPNKAGAIEKSNAGSMPEREIARLGLQLAEGLAAAHGEGIIHRDLKPGNVMITPDDKVKILDFGLAKALAGQSQAADAMHSPGITEAVTRTGVILGTTAYMSPEQAKGKVVDKRADIWGFGCVRYECLTAKRAFHGDTITETVAAILKSAPDSAFLPAETLLCLFGPC